MILDSFRLDGKIALETGSSRGLGAAIAVSLAEAGADVACHGNTNEPRDTCDRIVSAGRKTIALRGDLSKSDTAASLVDAATRIFGRIDILVNNAGIIRRTPAVDYSADDWTAVLQTNL